MNFELTSDQRLMVEAVQRAVSRDIQPLLDREPKDKPLSKAAALKIMGHAANLGLTAARVPESAGGAGMKVLDYGLMCEQLPTTALFVIMPQETTTARIFHGSSDEQKERFLPDLIAGRRLTCTAATEPGVGSDPRSIRTLAREEGQFLVITGRKMWISNATIADVINVTCTMQQGDKKRMVRVLVERDRPGFDAREIDVIGMSQSHLGEVAFNECRVPKINLLSDSGDVAKILTLTWLANRPILGLCAVQMAQRAFEMATAFAKDRSQFGKTIGGFQLIQQRLADIETAVVTSRLLCYHALAAIDRGERANGISAMAKRYAVEACDKAIALAMQVHGAMGLSRELGLERLARDVRMLTIPDGTSEILTLIQGREITGQDAFRG
jgi:alkylation response protein AidB-like acyl-CoA dehydrogenase